MASNALTAQDSAALQQFFDQQDCYGYWNYLANRGDRYALLALGIVTGETSTGFVANNFAASYAPSGSPLVDATKTQGLWPLGVELMKADLKARIDSVTNGAKTGDKPLDLTFRTIQQYHADVYKQFGLPPEAWVPYIPFKSYIDHGNWNTANQKWHAMIAPGLVNDVIALLSSLAQSTASTGAMESWLTKVASYRTVYETAFAHDGGAQYLSLRNADSINGLIYDKGKWRQVLSGGLTILIDITDPDKTDELNKERKFRQQHFNKYGRELSNAFDTLLDHGNAALAIGGQLLKGGTAVPEQPYTWVDANGNQYHFSPLSSADDGVGTLTIHSPAFAADSDPIVINNFDLDQARAGKDGYLGIKFQEQTALVADRGSDPFAQGNYTATDASTSIQGNLQAVTVYASADSDKDQKVALALNGADASQLSIPFVLGSASMRIGKIAAQLCENNNIWQAAA